jgi:hypothetical protein
MALRNHSGSSPAVLCVALGAALMAAPQLKATPPQGRANAVPVRGFCHLNFPSESPAYYKKGQPTYFTAIFTFPVHLGNYGPLFADYIAKKYSTGPGLAAGCSSGNGTSGQTEAALETQKAKVKEFGGTVVQTDWTLDQHQALMAELAKSAPPKPSATPAKAPAKPVDDDAPSPRSTVGATPPAKPISTPEAKPAPPAPTPTTYSYCSAYGTPASPPNARQHFYITQPFLLAPRVSVNQAFEGFLREAHPGEKISASCLEASALDVAQKSRQFAVDLKRKQSATFEIVEVDWKK